MACCVVNDRSDHLRIIGACQNSLSIAGKMFAEEPKKTQRMLNKVNSCVEILFITIL
jgi:hypothetical protein